MRDSKKIIEFMIIYNRYKGPLYNFICRMVRDKMSRDDLLQEVFLKLFKGLDHIRKKDSVNYWLFKTTKNEIYHYFRSRSKKEDSISPEETKASMRADVTVHEILEAREMKDLIRAELEKIPLEQKEIFLMKECGGLRYKEIAGLMGIDENLVKSRLHDVRQHLIRRISKYYRGEDHE